MAKKINGIEIVGDKEIMAILDEIAPKEAVNLARSTVYGIAARITKLAKPRIPIDEGTLEQSIYTKRDKSPPDKPVSSVRFRDSGFYWRFIEYGTKKLPPRKFLMPARVEVMGNIKNILREEFQKKLTRRIKAVLKKQAKK